MLDRTFIYLNENHKNKLFAKSKKYEFKMKVFLSLIFLNIRCRRCDDFTISLCFWKLFFLFLQRQSGIFLFLESKVNLLCNMFNDWMWNNLISNYIIVSFHILFVKVISFLRCFVMLWKTLLFAFGNSYLPFISFCFLSYIIGLVNTPNCLHWS